MSISDPRHWLRAKEIFSEALDTPPSGRADLVRERAAGDSGLVREVQELLDLHGEPDLAIDTLSTREQFREGRLLAGRYRIERRLGGGGMGEVFESVDLVGGGQVAVKTIRPLWGEAGQAEERFLREVRMARRIEHRNVCRVFDLLEHEGQRFCVMELLRGETLAKRIEAGPMSPAEALPVVRDLCAGLAAAHQAGVVHRDLKPSNVLLENGRAVIIDFGLAAAALEAGLTASGEVIGTLAYMAPEQLSEGKAGPASDIYALGVVMFEMLTGRKPHTARSPLRLVAEKARDTSPSAQLSKTGIPLVWRESIERCLRTSPSKRFARAGDVIRALERGRPGVPYLLSRRTVWLPVACAAAIIAGAGGWSLSRRDYRPARVTLATYEQGREALANGAPLRAAKLFEGAAAADDRFVSARAMLAAAYSEIDQPERARDAALDAAAAADRRWVLGASERIELRAARAAVVRNFAEAAVQYRALAGHSSGPARTFALIAAGRALEGNGDRAGALRAFEHAVGQYPSSAAARIRLAMMLARVGKPEQARAEFDSAQRLLEGGGHGEALSDLLLARASARVDGNERDRAGLERVLVLSGQTGNRYHALMAKLRLATIALVARDYERGGALARETAETARREGMPAVAAQALSELGYSNVYRKRPDLAEPLLREAMEVADRARASGMAANARLRLGEVLGSLHRFDEAVTVMEPAVAWMRESGSQAGLPLILIKWVTVLGNTPRHGEVDSLLRDARAVAARDGNRLYEAMAVQRMGGYMAERNPAQAAGIFEEAHRLDPGLHGPVFQAANNWITAGRYDRAEPLLAKGESLVRSYKDGVDKANFRSHLLAARSRIAAGRGECELAERLARSAYQAHAPWELDLHLSRTCSRDPRAIRESLAWLKKAIADSDAQGYRSSLRGAMAAMYLNLGDSKNARAAATKGLEESRGLGFTRWELENLLPLRAALYALGEREKARELEPRILEIARDFGFDPPEKFGGRHDLLKIWNRVR